ncbi:hypothetical protein KW789_02540 [Candidatus Saccharibacteria bacterium]|jgi:hypothetical protein|nr:hypothetical protein [Candidatus Saccharibacteria bacterium]
MSEMPAPEWGGPETETELQLTQPPGEVDYSLVEKVLEEGTFDAKLSYLPSLVRSTDRTAVSIGIDAIPSIIAEGIADPSVSAGTLDMLRDLWKEAMTSEDEDIAYDAQELYAMIAARLERSDTTTFGWLKDCVRVEWFD